MCNLFPLLSTTTVNLEYISIKTNGVILQTHYESRIWLSTTDVHQTHAFKNALSLQPAYAPTPRPGLALRGLQQTLSLLNGGPSLSLLRNTTQLAKGLC